MRTLTTSLLALAVLTAAGRADSYTLKVKPYPSKGKSFVVKTTDQLETKQTETEKDKPAKTFETSALRSEEYTQTTLTVADGKLATFQRLYAASTLAAGGKAEKTALDGKTVLFTLTDKQGCKHDLDPKTLPPEDHKKLTDAHTDGLVALVGLLPEKEVNEGDEWPLTGKQIVGGLVSIPVDPDKSKGKGKLVKVAKSGGTVVGTIEMEIELETLAGAEGTGKGKFLILAEAAIDGSSTAAKLTIKGTLTLEAGEKDGKTFRATAGGEFTAEVSEEK